MQLYNWFFIKVYKNQSLIIACVFGVLSVGKNITKHHSWQGTFFEKKALKISALDVCKTISICVC
jgi:hypothetical protein